MKIKNEFQPLNIVDNISMTADDEIFYNLKKKQFKNTNLTNEEIRKISLISLVTFKFIKPKAKGNK